MIYRIFVYRNYISKYITEHLILKSINKKMNLKSDQVSVDTKSFTIVKNHNQTLYLNKLDIHTDVMTLQPFMSTIMNYL